MVASISLVATGAGMWKKSFMATSPGKFPSFGTDGGVFDISYTANDAMVRFPQSLSGRGNRLTAGVTRFAVTREEG